MFRVQRFPNSFNSFIKKKNILTFLWIRPMLHSFSEEIIKPLRILLWKKLQFSFCVHINVVQMILQQTDNRLHFKILLPQKEFHCYFDEIFEAYQLLSPQHSVTIIQLTTMYLGIQDLWMLKKGYFFCEDFPVSFCVCLRTNFTSLSISKSFQE